MGTERSSKVIFVYEYLLPCSKYRGRFMVRFKVLFQSFKFRIRFVFGGGLAHSHFVFIIIYFLKYFNCLKENINYTLLDTVQQQHKYMYQDSTNEMQIVCILLKLHGALCSLARAVQLTSSYCLRLPTS